jgi:hypothetical protein
VQPAPFLQELLLRLPMRRVGDAGTCGAYLSTMRRHIGSHALGAAVGVDRVCGADSFIGALRSAVSTKPGDCSTFLSDDFVGYSLSFLPSLVFTIVTFPVWNVNREAGGRIRTVIR